MSSSGVNVNIEEVPKKKVNAKKNSEILGNHVRGHFEKYISDEGLDKIGENVFKGFKSYFDNSTITDYYKKEIGKTIRGILNIFVTLSINEKERDFKSQLFFGILNHSPILPNPDTPYYKTLLQNIGDKILSIIKQSRVSGGRGNRENTVSSLAQTMAYGQQINASQNTINNTQGNNYDDEGEDMQCFVNEKTQLIIKKFFTKDISPDEINDDILTEIQKTIFEIYNDETVRTQICEGIIDPTVDVIVKTASFEIAHFATNIPHSPPPSTPSNIGINPAVGGQPLTYNLVLETFYVLLDDHYVQLIIRSAGATITDDATKLSTLFLPSKTQNTANITQQTTTTTDKAIELFNKIAKSLLTKKNTKIPQKPTVSRDQQLVDVLNNAVNSLLGAPQKRGGAKDRIETHTPFFGPADYNIDNIISKAASDTYDKIGNELDSKLNTQNIQTVLTDFITNNSITFINDAEMVEMYNLMHDCLFETFTPSFQLHLFYVEFFHGENKKNFEQFITTIGSFESNQLEEYYRSSEEPVFITKIVESIRIKYKDETSRQNIGVKQPPIGGNGHFNINYVANTNDIQIPIINGMIYDLIMSRIFGIFKSNETKKEIQGLIDQVMLDKMGGLIPVYNRPTYNGVKSNAVKYTGLVEPIKLLIQNVVVFNDMYSAKVYDFLSQEKETVAIRFLKKALRISILGFIKSPGNVECADCIKHKDLLMKFTLFCLLNDYLYTGVHTLKINRKFNPNSLRLESKYGTRAYRNVRSNNFIELFVSMFYPDDIRIKTYILPLYTKNILYYYSNVSGILKSASKSARNTIIAKKATELYKKGLPGVLGDAKTNLQTNMLSNIKMLSNTFNQVATNIIPQTKNAEKKTVDEIYKKSRESIRNTKKVGGKFHTRKIQRIPQRKTRSKLSARKNRNKYSRKPRVHINRKYTRNRKSL